MAIQVLQVILVLMGLVRLQVKVDLVEQAVT
jgi:hypothetical protein